jgi:hypothetical protein
MCGFGSVGHKYRQIRLPAAVIHLEPHSKSTLPYSGIVEPRKMELRLSLAAHSRRLIFYAETLYLFTKSDFKTIFFPVVSVVQ